MTKRIPDKYKANRAYSRPKGWGNLYGRFFPKKTCGASRHAYMICDSLRDPASPIRRLLIDAGYEPDHWASSIEVTVVGLWEARQCLEWQELPPTRRYKYNGHWVPIARGIEAQSGEPPAESRSEGRKLGPGLYEGNYILDSRNAFG